MIQTLKNAFKIKEIRNKILLTILLVIIYRIGCYIPVPGIEASVFSDAVEGNSFMGIMSAITGGALSQGTLFAIGISPYINASIIMQLLTVAIPALERLSKEGEEGKHKIAVITRYVTLGLAVVNAVGILLAFNNESLFDNAMFGAQFTVPTWVLFIIVTIIFVAGSMLTMWIGERITELQQGIYPIVGKMVNEIKDEYGTLICSELSNPFGDFACKERKKNCMTMIMHCANLAAKYAEEVQK